MVALRSRLLERVASQQLCAPTRADAVTVSAVVVSEPGARPSGSHGVPTRRRRARAQASRAVAPASHAAIRPTAPASNLPDERWAGQARDRLHIAKTHSSGETRDGRLTCCSERSAVQDFMELEQDGARVTWPCLPRARTGAAAPLPVGTQASQSCGSDGCLSPSPGQEELGLARVRQASEEEPGLARVRLASEELLQELAELQKCGLRVVWPS